MYARSTRCFHMFFCSFLSHTSVPLWPEFGRLAHWNFKCPSRRNAKPINLMTNRTYTWTCLAFVLPFVLTCECVASADRFTCPSRVLLAMCEVSLVLVKVSRVRCCRMKVDSATLACCLVRWREHIWAKGKEHDEHLRVQFDGSAFVPSGR